MLRISKLADYGAVVMAFLARNAPEKSQGRVSVRANARTIAHETRLSVPTVSKLLKLLAHAGLLVSQRGVQGGYQLARPAETISVAAIIHALEEKTGLTECAQFNHHCALSPVCITRDNWRTLNLAIQNALESISLEALAQTHFKIAPIFSTVKSE